ncbi:MAG: single-stranded-DNA-specific exonuclease RecJ [Oscillospiraceae bacterium]|nr:single-stranded-DNA-specific exonuclease RecJ [Oscillospiraceae bacterium]MDD3832773.1 single-stranded-DNA-specific exonuclease RecJ [Oscillospiraceae bacterium]MDD4546325.1 single-stranded-DNA-specific exonuclease RecJ [Oscillospiraceae bacterium]
MSIKRWVMPPPDKEAAALLAEECELNPFLALMLVIRGKTDMQSVANFLLESDITDDPFAFADMNIAVDRLQKAIDNHEMIGVYGDYDADGITATVLLYSYLREKGADAVYYIPERESEGYGLHNESIDKLHKQGVRLIVTVDNGISAADEIDYASKLGIETIVTDHHRPPDELPHAIAVVNPHREDCGSEFKDYAGVGVAFKLVCAMEGDTEPILEKYGDLVAIGTLGDVMPLTGENRALVKVGLQIINHGGRPGIQALREVAGLGVREVNAVSAVFSLVPRLNAAGRMESPDAAARLLMTTQEEVAHTLAAQVQEFNNSRRSTECDILKQIDECLQNNPEISADRVIVIDGEDWHAGIIGIIAAKIVERYGKPCIIISTKDGEGKGSGRSIKGFSLYNALSACSDMLSRFGGHETAAGLSLPGEKIPAFRKRINQVAEQLYPEMPVPELNIDFKLRPSQVDVEKLNLIAALEPFGAGNPQPVFGLFGMRLDNIMPMGQGKHLRLSVSRDGVRLSVIRFNTTYNNFPFECGQQVNLVVTLERNEYKGVVTPSLLLKDIRRAEMQQDELIDALRAFDSVVRRDIITPEHAAAYIPDRAQLERTYRFVHKDKGWTGSLDQLCCLLKEPEIPYIRLRLSLEILYQAGLLSLKDNGDTLEIKLLPAGGKVDLTKTPIFKYLNSCLKK